MSPLYKTRPDTARFAAVLAADLRRTHADADRPLSTIAADFAAAVAADADASDCPATAYTGHQLAAAWAVAVDELRFAEECETIPFWSAALTRDEALTMVAELRSISTACRLVGRWTPALERIDAWRQVAADRAGDVR